MINKEKNVRIQVTIPKFANEILDNIKAAYDEKGVFITKSAIVTLAIMSLIADERNNQTKAAKEEIN